VTRTSAQAVIGVGVLVAAVSLLANPLGLRRYPGFGWLLEVGVIIGILAILAGFYLRGRAPRIK
jgi:uncharacterized membrane protein HdeD (DUF308 family)